MCDFRPDVERNVAFLPHLVLIAGLLVLAVTALTPVPAGAIWPFENRSPRGADGELDAGEILSRAIQFDTTNPPGNERPLAAFLVDLLDRGGLQTQLVETPGEDAPKGRAAAWARLRGTGHKRPLVLLSHLDVVPADEREWAVDPFEGLVGGGSVVGRGALDAKGIAVVHALALLELERSGVQLSRDIILLAVPDEETGGQTGSGFLVRSHPELLLDAELLLTEGGGIMRGQGSAPDIWGVTFTEKSPCWIEVIARGTPGHGSAASADAAIPTLVRALDAVRRIETEIRVTDEVARMFAALAPHAPPEDRPGLADLERALSRWPDFRERFLAEPGRNALVRNTVAITVIRGGERTNVVPAEARAQLDARLLPGETCRGFVEQVREAIDDPEVELRTILEAQTRSSPIDTDLFRAIETVAARASRPAVVVPRVIAGFTDAHYYRELGIVAYGFVPRWLQPRDTRGIHGPNERISIENLERGVATLVQILQNLE